MNKRIKELKDQCWVERRWNNDMWIEKHIDLEKFAELIVRECMSITEKCSTGPGLYDLFADKIIAEYFGVEE